MTGDNRSADPATGGQLPTVQPAGLYSLPDDDEESRRGPRLFRRGQGINFYPSRLLSVLVGLSLLGLLFIPLGLIVLRLVTAPLSLQTFWMTMSGLFVLLLFACFAYWTLAALMMRYRIESNAVVLRWGLVEHVVPLAMIDGFVSAVGTPARRRWAGIRWPGLLVGRSIVESIGTVVYFATHRRLEDLHYLVTPEGGFGISPVQVDQFRAELDRQISGGDPPAAAPMVRYLGPLRLSIWRDGIAIGAILMALTLNALLFAYVLYFFPDLPDLMPLHFNVAGEVDFVGPRQDVLRLPVIALALLLLNWGAATLLHIRERLASYVVLAVGILVQAMFWVATTRIVN